MTNFLHHVLGWTGSFNEAGGWYGWWSGFCGGFGILTLVAVGYRKVNCHTSRCWRLGHHEYEMNGATYKLCKRHHPATDKAPTHAQLLEHFRSHS